MLLPVYKGSYERHVENAEGPNVWRDLAIQRTKDFFRSVDYLESRPDIDHDRVGFYGVSSGASVAPRLLALEKRIKVAVVIGGGLYPERLPPEADTLNFAPRVTIPFLMINGKYDFDTPLNTCQIPLFPSGDFTQGQAPRSVRPRVTFQPAMTSSKRLSTGTTTTWAG